MVKGIFFVAFSTILFSCKDNNKELQDSTNAGNTANKEVNTVTDSLSNDEYSFLSEYSYKTLPLVDSTNFNNIMATKELTVQQRKLLHMDKILGENYSDVIQSLQINYKVNLSDNFITIVMSYELGEHDC